MSTASKFDALDPEQDNALAPLFEAEGEAGTALRADDQLELDPELVGYDLF